MDDNPIVTDMIEDYNIAENFEKYLFQRVFRMYQGTFAHRRSDSGGGVCKQKEDTEHCRTCPYSKDTMEERMDFVNQMAKFYG